MAGTKGQKKRFWSDEEQRSICAQTTAPGVSLAQVARRYAMNANLIHNWLKDPRFAPEPEIDDPDCHGGFLPVEIEGAVTVPVLEGNLVKIVWWDGQGACMFSRRLEKGKFV